MPKRRGASLSRKTKAARQCLKMRADESKVEKQSRQALERQRQHDRRQNEVEAQTQQRQALDRQRHQTRLPATHRIARQPLPLYVLRFSAGNMTVPCPYCGSFFLQGTL